MKVSEAANRSCLSLGSVGAQCALIGHTAGGFGAITGHSNSQSRLPSSGMISRSSVQKRFPPVHSLKHLEYSAQPLPPSVSSFAHSTL